MKVLLTGNLFHNYDNDIKDGLERCGHEVDMLFNNIHGPFQIQDPKTIPQWIKYGVLPHKLKINFFTERSVERYNQTLQYLIRKNKYDTLLVIGAKTIYEETISMFPGRKIFWFMDALPRYQYVMPKLHLFDNIFVFEPTDIQYIKSELGLKSKFLTLAFNPKRYYNELRSEQYDCSFVGSCYPKREDYLHALISVSENICICGDFYRSKYPELKKKMKKVNVPSEVANQLYNSSKINVNIHHPQSKEGMAIRTFEIIGAGGFQIMERQKGALQYFKEDQHMAFYESKEEFLDKCSFYLKNDSARKRIATNGYDLGIKVHTWESRIKEMQNLLHDW